MPTLVIPPGQEEHFLALTAVSPETGCTRVRASIQASEAQVTYACGDAVVVARFRHPSASTSTSTSAGDFTVAFDGSPPASLRTALVASAELRKGQWRWAEVTAGTPVVKGIPSDPRAGPVESVPRVDLVPRLLHGFEHAASLACLVALAVAVVRTRRPRSDWGTVGGLAMLAGLLREVVARVPANFYTDFRAGVPNYRYDVEYQAPLQSVLGLLRLPPTSLLFTNLLLGALCPVLLYLGLVTIPGAPDKSLVARAKDPSRQALVVAVLVATGTAFVRISATDAPHVVGLAWLCAGTVLLARSLAVDGWVWPLGVSGAAWLVAATRREFTLGPLLLAVLAWTSTAPIPRRRRAIGAVVIGLAASFAAPIAMLGRPNVEVGPRVSDLVAYFRALPRAVIMLADGVPLVVPLGLGLLFLAALHTRRPGVIFSYLALFVLQTALYALSPFASAIDHPMQSWALTRYALLWLLVPIYFAAIGWGWAMDMLCGVRWARWPLGLVVAATCLSAAPLLGELHGYQREYVFLRQVLGRAPAKLPLVAVWQKGLQLDYCEALAVPHYGVGETLPPRPSVALPTSIPLSTYVDALPAEFIYFRNSLPQVDLGRWNGPQDAAASLVEARRSDCALRTGKLLARERVDVRYIQMPMPNQQVELELWLVDREAVRNRLQVCP